jgi:hypothetical protein
MASTLRPVLCPVPRQRVRLLRAAHVGEGHIRAFFQKAFHDAFADAARTAGDQEGDFAL